MENRFFTSVKIAKRGLELFENSLVILSMFLVVLMPVADVFLRPFGTGLKGSVVYLQHLVLWLTFTSALITTRREEHLSLSILTEFTSGKIKKGIKIFNSYLSVAVTSALAYASFSFVNIGFDPAEKIGLIPTQIFLSVMFFGYGIMVIRFIANSSDKLWGKIITATAILVPLLVSKTPFDYTSTLQWIIIIVMIIAALSGTPIFVVLSAIAAALFFNSAGEITVLPNESYTILTGQMIPTIPLFTFAGFILSESRAGERLTHFFNALFGSLPGGIAIMAILVSAFFTTFTGASGITILALGGLLAFVMEKNKYPKRFTTGLLTSSGSLGLLFPPSLPIILYGVVAQINIKKMFLAGIFPGFLMITALSIIGIIFAQRGKIKRQEFSFKKLAHATKDSIWELLLPFVVIFSFFGGYTTIVETGAVAIVYAFIVEVFIRKDLKLKQIGNIILKCAPIIGGVLIILSAAKGLSYYIVDSQIPLLLSQWTTDHIQSKYIFLILLNIALLITGCFMDIFSAIIVVVPLIIPLGNAYGVNPIHLGIIFLANLELGYLTPPVGLNLFLAAFRFEQPLVKIYHSVTIFLVALLITVILITYIPALSTYLPSVIIK